MNRLIYLFLLFGLSALSQAETPGTWPLDKLKSEVPEFRYLDDSNPVRSLLYKGEKVDGQDTEVFAFYASPETLGLKDIEKPYPGIVLIHGGGGSAFANWANMWAERGYAAIAMDLGGRKPPAPNFENDKSLDDHHRHKKEGRKKLEKGGVADGRTEKFGCVATDERFDDWPFHAAANVMRAHSLIRSFPEVDAERTAVTGISWGGYTTCLSASLDDRFKAAVPVYGCGFLYEGESVQKSAIDSLGDDREKWIKAYDPSSHLGKCVVPTFWVNGTHDIHYPLDSYAKSYGLVKGPRAIRIEPKMGHSHPAGWNPKEIQIYIDSVLKNGKPLPKIDELKSGNDEIVVKYTSEVPVVKAALFYTIEKGLRSKRKWESIDAEVTDAEIKVATPPENANTWLITLTDERDVMISTEVFFR